MDKLSRTAWNFVAAIFLVTVVLAFILLVALTAALMRNGTGQPISIFEYLSLLWNYVWSRPLSAVERDVVIAVSQPLVLALSILALLLPMILMVRDKIENQRAVICCFRRPRQKNREKTAKELAKRFAAADDICIVSGDFSWFTEDGEAGLQALRAIVDRAHKGNHHLDIISYKTLAEVETALEPIEAELKDKFLPLVRTVPHLRGVKITIINSQDYRKLYMISSAGDGEAEQMVVVNDRDYGRKLINTFHGLVASAA